MLSTLGSKVLVDFIERNWKKLAEAIQQQTHSVTISLHLKDKKLQVFTFREKLSSKTA